MQSKRIKIRRNAPCTCGSGKKFKKCCIDKFEKFPAPIPEEVLRHFQNLPKEPFDKDGLLVGREAIGSKFKGKYVRAVRNRVYLREGNESFHEFLLGHLKEQLGKNWFENENSLEYDNQSILFHWFQELAKVATSAMQGEKDPQLGMWSVKLTGDTKALLALAYDVYSLKHCANILPKLLNRLKTRNEFQGAKYEIAVAAIAARSGFVITWLNADIKHCEFEGIHKETNERVAFEAKSHHREGVLNRVGQFSAEEAKVKIGDHVREALGQAPTDVPFVVFNDLNLPLTPGLSVPDKDWFGNVRDSLERSGITSDPQESRKFSSLFVTNFSWHFHDDIPQDVTLAGNIREREVLAIVPKTSDKPLQVRSFELLRLACRQYGFVPARLEERFESDV